MTFQEILLTIYICIYNEIILSNHVEFQKKHLVSIVDAHLQGGIDEMKKTIFKKWWFWVIVVVFLTTMVSVVDIELENTEKITIIDFSDMSFEEINTWCTDNNLVCIKSTDFSDNISTGSFISQSVTFGEQVPEGKQLQVIYSKGSKPTTGQSNALKSAESYLKFSSFSYKGLVGQLEFEGYPSDDIQWVMNNIEVDWFDQAFKSAKSYLKFSSFSLDSLIGQLEFEGFTKEEATFGAEKAYNE